VASFVDTCIMDRICHGFPPTVFMQRDDDPDKLAVLVLADFPSTDEERAASAAHIASSVVEMNLAGDVIAIAALFTDDVGKYFLLIAAMSSDGRKQFFVMTIDSEEDGVISIGQKHVVVNGIEASGPAASLVSVMASIHAALEEMR
jgi:hypothetical protein